MLRTLTVLSILAVSTLAFAQDKAGQRSPAEQAAISKLKQLGGHVLELAQNDPRLEVSFHLQTEPLTDAHLAPLKDLPTVVQLNLRGTNVDDKMLSHVAGLKSLTKLH